MQYTFKAKQIGPIIYGLSIGFKLKLTGSATVEATTEIENAENGIATWKSVSFNSDGECYVTAKNAAVRVTATTDCTLTVTEGTERELTEYRVGTEVTSAGKGVSAVSDPVTGGIGFGDTLPVANAVSSPISVDFKFSGSTSTAVPAVSTLVKLGATPISLIFTAGAGVTSAEVDWYFSDDASTANGVGTSWVRFAKSKLDGPGGAHVPVVIPHLAYKASVVSVTGGSVSAGILQGVVRGDQSSGRSVSNPSYTGVPAKTGRSIVLKTAIPIGIPCGGTMGDNGAFTLSGTAFFETYDKIYLYCKSGMIYSGSPAGVYLAVMSSTTAGVLYNNKLPSGVDPSIPETLVPFVCTGSGAFTGISSGPTVLTVPILGGSMGKNGSLEVEAYFTHNTSANIKVPGMLFGGQQFANTQVQANAASGFRRKISNRGQENRQVVSYGTSNTNQVFSDVGVQASLTPTQYAVDTSIDNNLTITMYVANTGDFIVMEWITVSVEYAS